MHLRTGGKDEGILRISDPGDERSAIADPKRAMRPSWLLWLSVCAVLGLVQVMFAGYQLGAGNQGIQVAFLKHLANPSLYGHDAMVQQTLGSYPSYFFAALARLLVWVDVPTLYFWGHLLTSAGVMAAGYALVRVAAGSHAAGLVMVGLLLLGHQRALGNDDLYSPGFSHTAAALPLAMLSLLLFYARRPWLAFAVGGMVFNVHALTGAYLLAMLGFAAVFRGISSQLPVVGWGSSPPAYGEPVGMNPGLPVGLWRTFGPMGLALLLGMPTLLATLGGGQTFSGEWITLTHIRSAHHTLPSTWWQTGATEIPRFVLLGALAAVAMSFSPPGLVRLSLLLLGGAAVLFAAGYVFTELYPTPLFMRAQPFRASRLVLVIFLLHIALGIVGGWRTGRWPERALAGLTLAVVAAPVLAGYLPAVAALATCMAFVSGRLSWWQAFSAGGAMLVCVVGWRTIHFPLPGLDFLLPARWELMPAMGLLFWVAAVVALGSAYVGHRAQVRWWLTYPVAAGLLAGALVTADAMVRPALAAGSRDDPWVDVQHWARRHTADDAVFLTPIQPGGFRIHSERSVVAEWRDGTQLFFSSDFGPVWWERMNALQPGRLYDSTGRRLLARGQPLDSLDDLALVELAERYGATHLVVAADRGRMLEKLYENDGYIVYLAELPPEPDPPDDARSAEIWAEQLRFMREVVAPNIEKHRKSDAVIRITDAAGRPVHDMPYELRLTNHYFNFGASLPFFQEPAGRATNRDYMPPPVDPRELERFLEIFNFSMIPFSGKWMYIEAERGLRTYDDLDRYIEWCVENDIRVEFHFLSGYSPAWMRRARPNQRAEAFLRHATDLVERYGDRIHSWQVVNEKHLLAEAPPVFQAIREILPQARLGISDCARFHASNPAMRDRDLCRGLEEVQRLQADGIQLDYFAFHAHRPFGVWPDVREAYYAMDRFADEGVRLHISEFMMPVHSRFPMTGPVRQGVWTDELQAEFYETFLAVCFSHPAVDAINFWGIGPHTWQPNTGLLDENYEPKPAFHAVKRLIKQTWHTEESGHTALDGTVRLRGFHGEYELILQTPDGTVRQTFSILPGAENELRVRLDGR